MPGLNVPKWIPIWNRKLHIYAGLYFLLFIWLFAFSGLLLNHPKWEFSRYWPRRTETSSEHPIRSPAGTDDLERARDLMHQLEMTGEIERIRVHPKDERFAFRVVRPGRIVDIRTDLNAGKAQVKKIETDGWGVLYMLHQFNGVRMEAPEEHRDWFATRLWTLSMDALCVGLILLVLSSLYMWYQIEQKRRPGLMVFGAGLFCCGFFVFGLRWIG